MPALLFVLAGINCYAQKGSVLPLRKLTDTSYIKSYYDKLDLGLNFGSQYLEYRTYFSDTFSLALRPNEVYTLTPALNYRWLSASFSFTPEFLDFNNDDSIRGETKYRKLSASMHINRFSMHAIWSSTTGFYLSNMEQVFPGWTPGDAYLQFPEMNVTQYMFTALYRTNKNFSLKSLFGGEEEQLKSAWTFLPGIRVGSYRFKIPNFSPGIGQIQISRDFDINFTLPVAGTWVFAKHAFISGGLGPVIGIDIYKTKAYSSVNIAENASGTRLSSGWYYQADIGYSHPKWYVGANTSLNQYRQAKNNNERLSKTFYQVNIYGGIRINAPRLLKRPVYWAEKIFPFLKK